MSRGHIIDRVVPQIGSRKNCHSSGGVQHDECVLNVNAPSIRRCCRPAPCAARFAITDLTENWQAVARVTNLAEAGFLENDLMSCGIESRIFASESFSAVAGRWSVAYLIQVPSHDATAARAQICQHLTGHGLALSNDQDQVLTHDEDRPISPVFWRPVALMVLAGMASFVVGQQLGGECVRGQTGHLAAVHFRQSLGRLAVRLRPN